MKYLVLFTIVTLSFFEVSDTLGSEGQEIVERIILESTINFDEQLVRRLILVRPGEPFSPWLLDQSIKTLNELNLFERIDVFSELGEDGLILRFLLVGYRYLIKTKVKGNKTIPTGQILDRLNLKVGSVPSQNRSKLLEDLGELYNSKGFFKALFDLTIEEQPGGISLSIEIKEGPTAKIGKIACIGFNEQKPLILALYPLQTGDSYDETKIAEAQNLILKHLKKQNYPFAKLSNTILEYDPTTNIVHLYLFGTLNEHLSLSISGNKRIEEAILKERINLDQASYFTPTLIRSWKQRLTTYYKEQGFPYVDISTFLHQEESTIKITNQIVEGNRYEIGRVLLSGSERIPMEQILDQIEKNYEAKYNDAFYFSGLRSTLTTIEQHYRDNGYPSFRLTVVNIGLDDDEAEIEIIVDEGLPLIFSSSRFQGAEFFSFSELNEFTGLVVGSVFRSADVETAKNRLLQEYHRRGFISVKIDQRIDQKDNKVTINFVIDEGIIAYTGMVIVQGNFRTSDSYILRKFNLVYDDPLDLIELTKARNAILRLGLFSSVEIVDLGEVDKDHHHDIIIKVVEDNAIKLEFGTGIGTEDTTGGIIRFEENKAKVFSEVSHSNILGSGKIVYVYGEINRRIPEAKLWGRKIQTGLIAPEMVFDYFDADLNLLHEKQDQKNFDFDRNSFIQGISRQFTRKVRMNLQYEFEYLKTFNITGTSELDDFLGLNTDWERLGSINWILFIENRNNRYDPTNGTYSRMTFSLFDNLFASKHNFYKIDGRQDLFFSPLLPITLHLTVRGGIASLGLNGDYIPFVKQFYLGGTGSVRGFEEDSITPYPLNSFIGKVTSNLYLNYLSELIFPIYGNFKGAVFTDGGDVVSNLKGFSLTSIRHSGGVGMRYQTPIGPLKLDYGVILDRQSDEPFGNLHFSIGFFL